MPVFSRSLVIAPLIWVTMLLSPSFGQSAAGLSIEKLLVDLHSASWMERSTAYDMLRANPNVLKRSDVRRALLQLLERENKLIESTLRQSNEIVSVDQKYGEGFGAYVAELSDTVNASANWTDPQEVCILVREAYDPESPFGKALAMHGNIVATCLIEMYKTMTVGLLRAQAPPVLARMLWAQSTQGLNAKTVQAARNVVLAALIDPHPSVRSGTVRALGSLGQDDMIPPLQQVAESDPAVDSVLHSFWIREYARTAIEEIRKRSVRR